MADDVTSLAAADVQRCLDECQELLDEFDAEVGPFAERRLASAVLVAIAALETVVQTPPDDDRREPALLIAVTLAREAAAAVGAGSADARLRGCADACERAAALCQAELDAARR